MIYLPFDDVDNIQNFYIDNNIIYVKKSNSYYKVYTNYQYFYEKIDIYNFPYSSDVSVVSNNFIYRNDICDIFLLFFILFIFIVFIPVKLIFKFFKKGVL